MRARSQEGRGRVLLVEDELMIALELQSIIEEAGYDVVGPLRAIEKALTVIETEPPMMALLDLNLDGVSSAPIAEALQRRGIPFAVVTGYPNVREEQFALRNALHLEKPYSSADVVRLLDRLRIGAR